MKKLMVVLMFGMLPAWLVNAHGVHDSGQAKPQKGGVLKSLETIHLEFVQIGKEIRVYIYDKSKKQKILDPKKFPVSAKAILPRGKGEANIPLVAKKDYWSAQYDAKGMHRYDFQLNIEQGGHKDKVLFTVEPK